MRRLHALMWLMWLRCNDTYWGQKQCCISLPSMDPNTLLQMAGIVIILRRRLRRRAEQQRRLQRQKSIWMKPWLERCTDKGAYVSLIAELRAEEPDLIRNFFRMESSNFDYLLEKVRPVIERQNTQFRVAVSAAERLAITLRYLATGDTFASLVYLFRVHRSTISQLVPETCDAIYQVLKRDYLRIPSNEEQWKAVAKDYADMWNFPNCIGAIDGKHVRLQAPRNSGSEYYNYKGSFSIVLMAVSDAHCRFTYLHVGTEGRVSDGGTFDHCAISGALKSNTLHIPPSEKLPGTERELPYVLLADEAFPLKHYIMKPYPNRGLSQRQRIYNYRLSRARRCVESAFGILSHRFRFMMTANCCSPDRVEKMVLASCVLHNFLLSQKESATSYAEVPELPAGTRNIPDLPKQGTNNYTSFAKRCRDEFADYFVSPEGAVAWQLEKI